MGLENTHLLRDHTIQEFCAVTAGSDPVPGGGSVSALIGALSASLTQMVANLTVGRKKYAEVDEEMREVAKKVQDIRHELIQAIDKDSEAYNEVSRAFKMPKETEWEKETRSAIIQEATKKAAAVPMEIAKTAFDLVPLIDQVVKKGNQNAITDGCIAMMSCRLAVLGACLNVRINLGSIKDEEFVKSYAADCDALEKQLDQLERGILDFTYEAIK